MPNAARNPKNHFAAFLSAAFLYPFSALYIPSSFFASRFPAAARSPSQPPALPRSSSRFFAARVSSLPAFLAACAFLQPALFCSCGSSCKFFKKIFKKILTYALKNSKINPQVTLTIMLRCYAHFCRAISIFSMRFCTTRKGTE